MPSAYYSNQQRMAVERMDILETLPKKGCNAQRCRNRVVMVRPGPFAIRRLCLEHAALYRDHDVALARIRSISSRDIL